MSTAKSEVRRQQVVTHGAKLCKRVSEAFNLNVIIETTTPNLRGTEVNEIDRIIIEDIEDSLCI
jgi:hypothetical protein